MGRIVDTGIWIRADRAGFAAGDLFADQTAPQFVSIITASELIHGVERASPAARRELRSRYVEDVLSRFAIVPIDLPVARIHASLAADLQSRGVAVGPHDLWIAATCLTFNHSVLTLNVVEFNRIPGLTVETWNP